ncbi:MAG: DNA polymerase III subunit alpha [Mycoplasmataceae bacterium]|nr:DNA polymerase III subunit alpha [Mycoplasmataceae bacterium]
MSKINNLHFFSEYSFFESPTKIKDYVEFAKQNEMEALVLTDHNNVHGFAEFKKYCFLNKIKPIFDIDLDFENGRLILLSKNKKGFEKIKELSFLKSKNVVLKIEDIDDDNLFTINHPIYGYKNVDLLNKKLNNFYFYEKDNKLSNIYVQDCRIINKKNIDSLNIINKLKGIELKENYDFQLNFSLKIEDEKIINNINKIINECNVVFEEKKNMLPNFCSNPLEYLKKIIKEKFNEKKDLQTFDKNVVENRIKYEISIIEKMNVENYFLIISDLIFWAKKNDIYIGPGRGSVAGSLIAYIIGITEINPLVFDLYFERFLNPERISMPDIDIDIQDNKRELVINYLKEKYGYENVSQICTFQRIGAKQALKDCARFLNINFSKINEITKIISSEDSLNESYEKNIKFKSIIDSEQILTKLFNYSILIESLPRQIGVHAAGVVISKEKIINSIPITYLDGNIVTQFSMEFIEDWDLLKIDLLGLKTLTIIKKIEEEIQLNVDKNFQYKNIPLNDEKTNKLLNSGKVLGIFQLESPGMIKTINKVKINNFNDLVDIISLFRPGPLSNISTYIKNKNNRDEIEKIEKEYDQIVRSTNGIIIYQEQIMEIIQKIAKLDFSKADILRKAISKKNKEDILQIEKLFINKAIENNVDKKIAEKIYEQIVKFAEYGFNKSHAVSYATLSYKMAYLKARYPLYFYAGIIATTSSIDTINKIVLEAKELKFNIESPMINKISKTINHDKKNNIFLPLTFIKGLGNIANEKILNEFEKNGKFSDFFNFIARAKRAMINDSIIDILIESNTLREFGNMATLLNNKNKALTYASAISYEDKNTNEIILDLDAKKPKLEIVDQDINFEAQNEIKYLGMIYNSFATSKYETNDKLINLKIGIEYKIVLLIKDKKEILDKNKKTLYCVEVLDSSMLETVWFNEKNKQIFDSIEKNTIGYATIIKLENLKGKKYININKWDKINN